MNTLYFVEHKGLGAAKYFLEIDRDSNSRQAVIDMIRSGEVDPVKVLEVCEDEGTVRDITGEIVVEARLPEIQAEFNRVFMADHARDYLKHEVA